MQGVNWFGFETSATMVAGLWAGSSSLTQNFKTIIWHIKLLVKVAHGMQKIGIEQLLCIMLQGVNWFGFETSATMVAGLWAGSSSLTQDFKTVVWRMRLLGFNAVRLPFSFKVSARAQCLLCRGPRTMKQIPTPAYMGSLTCMLPQGVKPLHTCMSFAGVSAK